MTERVAFKIFSIINHTKQWWQPRGQMEIQTKGPCGERQAGLGEEEFGVEEGRFEADEGVRSCVVRVELCMK